MKSNLTKLIALIAILFFSAQGIAQEFNGYALYNAQNQSTTYLIDKEGDIAHTWSCPTSANYALAISEEGHLVRGAVYSGNEISGAAIGGMIQVFDADANIVWEFIYSSSTYISHHDICLMPNGNVLMIAWEEASEEEIIAMGYDDDGDKYATHIIEVQQNGEGGEIVWEWHIMDHMVQDIDSELPNYGVISEHPELLDINVSTSTSGGGGGGGGGPSDWFHVNGIDYNESLDQIVFSSRFLSEIFIIDHSTTTEEAASHEGGNSGMGGDFLYRWGNPENYGVSGDQIIPAACHDARWIIDDGRLNGGMISVFNNEGNGGDSSIDYIDTPENGYNYDHTAGQAYEPTSYSYRHECIDSSPGQSASDIVSNSNIFVNLSGNQGGGGYMYEVDTEGNVVFQYNAGSQKGFRYECDHPGIQIILDDPCEQVVSINEKQQLNFTVFPNPSNGVFNLIGEFGLAGPESIVVFDIFGKEVASFNYEIDLDLRSLSEGVYFLSILDNGKSNTKKICISK